MPFFHNVRKKQLLLSLDKTQAAVIRGKLNAAKHKANLVQITDGEHVLEISFVGRGGLSKGEAGYFYNGVSNPPIIHSALADLLGTNITGARTTGKDFQPQLLPNSASDPILSKHLQNTPAPTPATVNNGMVYLPYNSPNDPNSVGANTTLCAKPLVFKIPGYPATLEAPSLEVFYQLGKVSLGARLPSENILEYHCADGTKIYHRDILGQAELQY